MKIEFEKYIKDTLEVKQLGNAYDFVFNKIDSDGEQLKLDQYIKTCSLETLREWEIYLDIPEDTSLTLEERKGVVLLRLFQKPPYTLKNVKKQILAITGAETLITFDYLLNKLNVRVNNLTEYIRKMISLYLDGVKPVNVIYLIRTETNDWQEVYDKYNWETLSEKTWQEVYDDPNF